MSLIVVFDPAGSYEELQAAENLPVRLGVMGSLATLGPRSSKLVKSYAVWHSKGLVFYATLNACPMIYCL